jgi:hypothetical protein
MRAGGGTHFVAHPIFVRFAGENRRRPARRQKCCKRANGETGRQFHAMAARSLPPLSHLSAQEDVGGEPAMAGIGIEIIVIGQNAGMEQGPRIGDEAIEARYDAANLLKAMRGSASRP